MFGFPMDKRDGNGRRRGTEYGAPVVHGGYPRSLIHRHGQWSTGILFATWRIGHFVPGILAHPLQRRLGKT